MDSVAEIRRVVGGMHAYEERFWREVGPERERASRLLDIAVEWISAGRGNVVDPYALVLSWLGR